MKKKDQNNDWFTSSDSSSNISNPTHNRSVSRYVEQTYSLRTFHFIAGFSQIFLGLAVVTISVLGLIQPQWVATALIMVASVTTMIGFYLVYITASQKRDSISLMRSAMQRVMQHKN